MVNTGRILNMGKNCAAMNMAIDEAILTMQKEQPNPTLRFYDWSNPAFSFGYFQDISSDIDVRACREEKIGLVKRMTGGGTVVHGWDLTYSLILPRFTNEKTVSTMYQLIGRNLVCSLVKIGIPATSNRTSVKESNSPLNICLTNLVENDVLLNGKKIAGVSVRRNRIGVLFQGYISLDNPPKPILKRASKHKEGQKDLIQNSYGINTEGRLLTRERLIHTICDTFDIGISFHAGNMSEKEQKLANELVTDKYDTDAWNFD